MVPDNLLAFAKLASTAIASRVEAEAGEAANKLMTPERVAQAIAALSQAGSLVGVQVFTASATYTPTAGATKGLVFVTGGGAGGSSCPTGQSGVFAGGGAGATAIAFVAALSSRSVTIGAGGNSNGNGGQSAFGAISANGGSSRGASGSDGGDGATATANAVMSIPGGPGGNATTTIYYGGAGGNSFWGQGAVPPRQAGNDGTDATLYGAGGAGGRGASSGQAGGKGKSGVVLVLELA